LDIVHGDTPLKASSYNKRRNTIPEVTPTDCHQLTSIQGKVTRNSSPHKPLATIAEYGGVTMTSATPIQNAKYINKQRDLAASANTIPEIGFLRKSQVLALIPISSSSWYNGIANGIYPAPVKLSERSSAWRVEDIRNLIAELGATQ